MSTAIEKVLLIFDRSAVELGYKTTMLDVYSFIPAERRMTRDEVYRLISKNTPKELVIVSDGIDHPTNPYLKFSVNPKFEPDPTENQEHPEVASEEGYIFGEESEEDNLRDDEVFADNVGGSHSRYMHEMKPEKVILKRALELTFEQRDSGEIADYTETQRSEERSPARTKFFGREVRRVEIKFTDATKRYLRSIGIDPRKIRMLVPLEDIEEAVAENLRGVQAPTEFEVVNVSESSDRNWDVRYKVRAVQS